MALEQVFFDPNALKRFRAGPLASNLDDFSEWLSTRGFARCTIRRHISNVSHFSRSLEQKKLASPTSFNSDHVRRFITEHLPHCKHRRPGAKHYHRVAFSIHRFVEYLQEGGPVDIPDYCPGPYHKVMDVPHAVPCRRPCEPYFVSALPKAIRRETSRKWSRPYGLINSAKFLVA